MRRILLLSFLLSACGGGESTVGTDTSPSTDTVDAIGDIGFSELSPGDSLADAAKDSTPDTPQDTATDIPPELPGPACEPGEGCFLDPCQENSQCLSGWCVEHMGDGVCSKTCTEDCPQGWTCKQVGASDPDLIYVCVSNFSNLCKPCVDGGSCKAVGAAEDVCVEYGAEGSFCGGACETDEECPWGFSCLDALTVDGIETRQCAADAGTCPCTDRSVSLSLWTPCKTENDFGVCPGKRICMVEGLSDCDAAIAAEETCYGTVDYCVGDLDEPIEDQGDYINLCDDENPCTDDNCLGEDGCEHVDLTEGECLDGDPCTVADHCEEGVCVGNPVLCDDENPCTDDSCNGAGGCLFENNTADCDDGDPCTVADECQEGVCAGVSIPCDCQADEDCQELEDGDLCNGTLVCDKEAWPYKCVVDPETVVTCPLPDPGPNAFCLQAACAADTGACDILPANDGYACDDGNACTYAEACDQGVCGGGQTLNCMDANPCTDDGCEQATGCVHTDNAEPCNDGDACTVNDTCSGGTCVGEQAPPCDDGNPCTDDVCQPGTGCIFSNNSAGCDDGNACTVSDECSGGVCVGGQALACGDDDPCTDTSCDPATGCVVSLNSAPCDDGDPCTIGDVCDTGTCVGGPAPNCNDGNPCTDDSCDQDVGCVYSNNSEPCNDGNACTTDDACSGGACLGGEPLACDDGNTCTDDTCDSALGCVFTPNVDGCDDGNDCTEGDQCQVGWCVPGSAKDCDDMNPCTLDLCDPDTSCYSVPVVNGTPCGQLEGEVCMDGQCACVPDCDGKTCGDDGCDGSCGTCGEGEDCVGGNCQCVPDCDGKECGDDGCGGACGACQGLEVCQGFQCIPMTCGTGVSHGGGCLWLNPGVHEFVVPANMTELTVTLIGGGGGGGSGFYYMGGGGGSGYYMIEHSYSVIPGQTIQVVVGQGGGMGETGGVSSFGTLSVQGGKPGLPHSSGGPQPSAKGGAGGSGGGAGYTNSDNGGGAGSGIVMGSYAGIGGMQSPGTNQHGFRGEGYGAGGGGDSGTSGYSNSCGGQGGYNGSNGQTVGPCGGGGGGAGGMRIPNYSTPGSTQTTTGTGGAVWITF